VSPPGEGGADPRPTDAARPLHGEHALPLDPDVERSATPGVTWDVIAVIALGGALGSLARWALGQWIVAGPGGFPWATFAENVSGCLALGVLMVLVQEVWPADGRARLLRPFAGVGVLGGWTTFSTYALDTRGLLASGHGGTATAYLVGSVLGGLLAVWAGISLTESLVLREPA
jgi:fluoride exporter